jgi:hypothetical protein
MNYLVLGLLGFISYKIGVFVESSRWHEMEHARREAQWVPPKERNGSA